MIVVIALDCAFHLGVSLAAFTSLGHWPPVARWKIARVTIRPTVSNLSHSPRPTAAQQARIRGLAEQLDAHRKRQHAQHPKLTLTDMYNVLDKLRAGEPLSVAEKVVHEQGLVSVLRQLHDELDAAMFDAYGWPAPSTGSGCALTDEEVPGATGRPQRWRGPLRKRKVTSCGRAPNTRRPRNTQYAIRSRP